MENHSSDINKIKRLTGMTLNSNEEIRRKIILRFLEYNTNVDDFKKINLLSLLRSWSGSEVALIEKDINYLQSIVDDLRGIKYLEHKAYSHEYIDNRVRYKEKVLLEEYLDNF